jgi:hypothetical protein
MLSNYLNMLIGENNLQTPASAPVPPGANRGSLTNYSCRSGPTTLCTLLKIRNRESDRDDVQG